MIIIQKGHSVLPGHFGHTIKAWLVLTCILIPPVRKCYVGKHNMSPQKLLISEHATPSPFEWKWGHEPKDVNVWECPRICLNYV